MSESDGKFGGSIWSKTPMLPPSTWGQPPKKPEPPPRPLAVTSAPKTNPVPMNVPYHQATPLTAEQLRLKSLATQLANAMRDEMVERGMTMSAMADFMNTRWETVQRCMSGRGQRVETIELLCRRLGWNLTVTDAQDRLIVTYPPR